MIAPADTEVMEVQAVLPRPVVHALPRVNLLPAEILEARRFRKVQTGLGAAVVATTLVVGGLWFSADQEAAAEQERLDAAAASQTRLNREVAGLKPVTDTYRLVEERQRQLTTATAGEVLWSRYLTDISLSVPDRVRLTSLTLAPITQTTESTGTAAAPSTVTTTPGIATLTFVGKALSHDDVAVWLDSQAKQQAFTNVTFSDSKRAAATTGGIVTFTSTATVTTAALNPVYLTPTGE